MNSLIISILTITLFVPLPASSQPRNFHEKDNAMKGAVLGFAKKPVYFDIEQGMSDLQFLYDRKGVRTIMSLDHCKDMTRLIDQFKRGRGLTDLDITHVCRKIRRGKRGYKKNVLLFEEVGNLIRSDTRFYIHCRYGAHRAVTALTGGWVNYSRVSFKEGFRLAGGNKSHFRSKGHHELLNHARRYSQKSQKFYRR